MHMHMRACYVHACTCACIHVYVYVRTYVHMYICMYACMRFLEAEPPPPPLLPPSKNEKGIEAARSMASHVRTYLKGAHACVGHMHAWGTCTYACVGHMHVRPGDPVVREDLVAMHVHIRREEVEGDVSDEEAIDEDLDARDRIEAISDHLAKREV